MKTALIGESPSFARLLNTARMVAATDVNLLLLGESGTGRETLARDIHAASPRRGGPFLRYVCTGAPAGGLEILLADHKGSDACLYLSEVADLPPEDQAWLWRLMVQQDALKGPAALRLIVSSAEDLDQRVRQNRFRRDLYQSLCVVPLEVPALRERALDIPALTQHFLRLSATRHRLEPPRLRAGAERLLRRYHWPGNLRELANLCERLVILLPGADVGPENLPAEVRRGDIDESHGVGFELPPQGIDLNDLEADLIRQALSLSGGNKSRAARLLGLTRDTLLYRLQKHLIPG